MGKFEKGNELGKKFGQVSVKPGVEVEVVPEEGVMPAVKVEVPTKTDGRGWSICEECGRSVWRDIDGTFYHKLACSKSNGIGYGDERNDPSSKHHQGCTCYACKPPRG